MMKQFAMETEKRLERQKDCLENYKKQLLEECLKSRVITMKFPYKKIEGYTRPEPNWKSIPIEKRPRWAI